MEKDKKLIQYDVEVEVMAPVILHHRVVAESLEQAEQIIKNKGLYKNLKHFSPPKPLLNRAKKKHAKIKTVGSSVVQSFIKLSD